MSANYSPQTTSTSSQQIDNSITARGDVLSVKDSPINTGGGALTIQSANADVARAALETVKSLANTSSASLESLAAGSNAIAAKVAASQAAFVESASGQKTLLYIVGGLALLVAVPIFRNRA